MYGKVTDFISHDLYTQNLERLSSVGRYDTKSINTTDIIQFIVSVDTQCQRVNIHDLFVSVAAFLSTFISLNQAF